MCAVHADVNISDWSPGYGSAVANIAVAPVRLRDTNFINCQQESPPYGLIDSYSDAAVELQGVAFIDSSAATNLVGWGGGSRKGDVFYSDVSQPVAFPGGVGEGRTMSLDENRADVFLSETDSHLNQIKLVRLLHFVCVC